ncbi:MAG: ribulokinase [bacterium]
MATYAIGLDYGTNSCRSLIVNLESGAEVATHVFNYPSGEMGVLVDAKDPNVARQQPQDYLTGLETILAEAVKKAAIADKNFSPAKVVGIGIDTTGSTPLPVTKDGTPLAFLPEFKDNLAAMTWLWKDHTSYAEATEITEKAKALRPQYLAKCGGIYSSEWFWSKLLHCKRSAPEVFNAAFSWVEICDWLPAVLSGNVNPLTLLRGVCAAGHKAFYSDVWGGLPDKEFLAAVDPALAELRDRLFTKAYTAEHKAGELSAEWAAKTGLKPGTAIAVGAFDCHMGAAGAGVREGTLAKILGTSTCDVMVVSTQKPLADIPGVCGIVDGSVMANHFGIEAGQSAVGDIFLWFTNNLLPESYGKGPAAFAKLDELAGAMKPGATGLLALDWNNGNRSVLTDVRLSGLLLGQTLHTKPHEIYRALVEATAFGGLTIINRVRQYGVRIDEVITCGGIAVKSPFLMQIYADILNMPMKVAASDQTCALGAAFFGAVAGGAFKDALEAQSLSKVRERVYSPIAENVATYKKLFVLYTQLHDGFGIAAGNGNMGNVMKDLIALREATR